MGTGASKGEQLQNGDTWSASVCGSSLRIDRAARPEGPYGKPDPARTAAGPCQFRMPLC